MIPPVQSAPNFGCPSHASPGWAFQASRSWAWQIWEACMITLNLDPSTRGAMSSFLFGGSLCSHNGLQMIIRKNLEATSEFPWRGVNHRCKHANTELQSFGCCHLLVNSKPLKMGSSKLPCGCIPKHTIAFRLLGCGASSLQRYLLQPSEMHWHHGRWRSSSRWVWRPGR